MFAERYRLKFATTDSEKDEGSIIIDTDTEDDSDEFENALEDVEIDQSSELYKTIVAAIIENEDNIEDEIDDDAFEGENSSEKINITDKEEYTVQTEDPAESEDDPVHLLLEEAAEDGSVGR